MAELYLPDAGGWIDAMEAGRKAGMTDRRDRAARTAGGMMSSGDYQGAASVLMSSGDLDSGVAVGNYGLKQQEATKSAARQAAVQAKLAAGDYAGAYEAAGADKDLLEGLDKVAAHARETTGLIAAAAKQLEGKPVDEARALYKSQIAPGLVARGLPADKVNAFDPTPENLQAVIAQSIGLEKTLEMSQPKVVGNALVTPQGKEIYRADKYMLVPRDTDLVEVGGSGGQGGGQAPAQPAGAAAAAPQGGPRGLRNNNPLNVSALPKGQAWDGQTGTDGQYAVFSSPEAGWAAADKNLQAYATRHGINTVAGVIQRWAPPSENDTPKYVDTVARRLRVDPNAPLNLADPSVRKGLLEAMAEVEVGKPVSFGQGGGSAPAAGVEPDGGGRLPGGARVLHSGKPKAGWVTLTPAEVDAAGLPQGSYQKNTDTGQIQPLASGVQQKTNSQAIALRKEFDQTPDVKAFNDVAASYDMITRLSSAPPTAARDMSQIFAYMKMLDPGSVVREGEFASAQNAAGIPDRIRNMYNRAISGQMLNPKQRDEFAQAAGDVYQSRKARYDQMVGQYKGYARDMGLPDDTITPRLAAGPGAGQPKKVTIPGASEAQNAAAGRLPAKRGQAGEQSNPYFPVNERQYKALKPGVWYVHPDGQLKQKGGS